MKTSIRLIVTDMDGTLLDANHQLPPNFSETVHALRQSGIRWGIASGRQLANLKKRFETLNVPVDIIAENGALAQCAEDDEPFFQDLTAVKQFRKVLQCACSLLGVTPVLCGSDCAWVHDVYPENFAEVARYFEQTAQWHTIEDVLDYNICKLAIYHPNAAERLYPELAPYATEQIRVILSGPNWVDVQVATVDKGHALNAVMERYGITPKNVIVFGDYFNDVGMMTCGAHAVAMGNAKPEILALTPYHTLPNTQNGVMAYLQRLRLVP